MTQTAEIIPLPASRQPESGSGRSGRRLAVGPILLALILVAGCFVRGLYDFWMWGALAACLFAAVVATAHSRSLVLTAPARVVAAGLGVLLALSALSMTWADSVDRAWVETNRIALYLAAFAVGCVLVRSATQRRVLAVALAPLFGVAALVVLLRLFVGDAAAFIDHRLDAPLDYINGSAGFLLMGLWPLAAAAERHRSPLVAGLAAAGVVVQANLLVLTQSRAMVPALLVSALVLVAIVPGRTTRLWILLVCGAAVAAALPWTLDVYASRDALRPAAPDSDLLRAAAIATAVGALAAGALWGLAMWVVRAQRGRFGAVATGAAVLAVAGVLTAGVVAVDDPAAGLRAQWERFTTNEVDQTTTIRFADAGGRRYDLWRVAWREFERDPVRGVGAGSYGLRYFQLRGTPEPVRQPHSLPLQMLAELGVGGALGLGAVIAGLAWGLLRARNVDRAVAVACGGVVISWLVHTSVDWLWNLPALTCLALLAGSALVMSPSRGSPPVLANRTRLTAVVAIVLVAFAAASLGRSYAADRLRARAAADVATDPGSALRESRRALVLNPASLETHYLRAAAFARLGAAGLAEDTLRQAIKREPLNFVPWALLGDLQVRRGRIAQARRAYARALELNPREPALRLLVADPRRALS